MLNRAREDCRLLPYRTNDSMHMDLPTLEIDTTISDSQNNTYELIDLLNNPANDTTNLMITGSGGCGKTYSLLYCADMLLSDNSGIGAIPFYIPLNTFNGASFKGMENYVIERIVKYCGLGREEAEKKYYNYVAEANNTDRKIVFLCDGFNEVVDVDLQTSIAQDITELQYNDVYRFAITSRYNLSSTFAKIKGGVSYQKFTPYKVNDLDSDNVKTYVENFLKSCDKSETEREKIIKEELMKSPDEKTVKNIFQKPMALIMFCGIHSNTIFAKVGTGDFIKPIKNLGELLHDFILCVKYGSKGSENIKNSHYLFLQYLGYRMNTDGLFTIVKSQFDEYCKNFLEQFNISGLSEYEILHNDFVNDILKYEGGTSEVPDSISFNHQNFRDYFAASFLRDFIWSKPNSMINVFIGKEKKIPHETSELLAELLGEYNFTSQNVQRPNDSEKSAIQKLFSRNLQVTAQDEKLSPSAIAYLIDIAVIGRERDMSLFDFTGLDLSLAQLNGVKLSVNTDKTQYFANFSNSIISKETFAPLGHAGAPLMIIFIEKEHILSFSKNTICYFNMKKGIQTVIAEYSESVIPYAVRIGKSNRIISGDSAGILTLWEFDSEKETLTPIKKYDIVKNIYNGSKKIQAKIQDICLKNDNDVIFSVSCGEIYSFDVNFETSPSLLLSVNNNNTEKNRYCRLKQGKQGLYISYGSKIYKIDENLIDNNRCVNVLTKPRQGCIYDMTIVTFGGIDFIVANFLGDKISTSNAISGIYVVNSSSFDSPNDAKVRTFEEKTHSVSNEGFLGWNRFSPYDEDESCAYLCANINYDSLDSGVYKLIFSPVYNRYREIEDLNIEKKEVAGNTHKQSVEYVTPFKYNNRKYLATSCMDRSVEIMDISGTENYVIYHFPGHTDGVTCMNVVDSNTIYTCHYSGEVCSWHYSLKNNKWSCIVMEKPHTDWVWTVNSLKDPKDKSNRSYIVGGSYDHNISLTDDITGRYVLLTGQDGSKCKGNVKMMEVVPEYNCIVATYNYKDKPNGDGTGNTETHYKIAVFYDIDFSTGNCKFICADTPGEEFVRCLIRYKDGFLICVNAHSKSIIYKIDIDYTKLFEQENPEVNSIFSDTEEHSIVNDKVKPQMRGLAVIEYAGKELFACGGNVGDFYIEVWDKNKDYKFNIPKRPQSIDNINYTESDGISCMKFVTYKNNLYLLAGSYDYHTYVYKIDVNANDDQYSVSSIIKHSDKVMDIRYTSDKNGTIYISLFNGKVFSWNISELADRDNEIIEEDASKMLFQCTPGLNIMGVDFTLRSVQSTIPDDFKKKMSFYGII